LRVGIPKEYFGEGLDREVESLVRDAIGVYETMGAEIVDVSLPRTDYAVATYYIIAPAEASSNLARYDGVHYGHRSDDARDTVSLFSRSRAEGFGAEVQRRILLGTYALSAGYYDAFYLKAGKVRRLIKQDFDAAFEKVDVLACPASPAPAFRFGEKADPLSMYLSDVYTIPVNLAGNAAISIPCCLTEQGLPVGLQLIAQSWEEARLLRAARAFERASENPPCRPDL
jgi:aspartyl-tRNA(Asn)/glutamyl-tRNA(Gln) amidotransferase subunit A